MAEKVVIGNAELWQGDCLEVMAELPPMSVDAVITDPPYMIGAISTGDASAKAGGWAHLEGRRFIGIEREHEYFHGIAVPRVTSAQAQEQMFAAPKVGAGKTAVQEALLDA